MVLYGKGEKFFPFLNENCKKGIQKRVFYLCLPAVMS